MHFVFAMHVSFFGDFLRSSGHKVFLVEVAEVVVVVFEVVEVVVVLDVVLGFAGSVLPCSFVKHHSHQSIFPCCLPLVGSHSHIFSCSLQPSLFIPVQCPGIASTQAFAWT